MLIMQKMLIRTLFNTRHLRKGIKNLAKRIFENVIYLLSTPISSPNVRRTMFSNTLLLSL